MPYAAKGSVTPLTSSQVAALSAEYLELKKYQWRCATPYCNGLPHQGMPYPHARHNQLLHGHSVVCLITGRGYGKTRAGAQRVAERMMETPNHGVLIMAESKAKAKSVCIKGPSGLLRVIPPYMKPEFNSTDGILTLANGSWAQVFGCNDSADAEAPRGFESGTAWCEEMGTWRHQKLAWDMIVMANRSKQGGVKTQIIVTTTPRPTPVIKMLIKWGEAGNAKIIRGSTFDNAYNLDPSYVALLKRQYEGSALGRQELYGEMVEDVTGALWDGPLIEATRVDSYPELVRKIVGVDPSGGGSSEAGIILAGRGLNGHGYILADHSGLMSSDGWGRAAVDLYHSEQCDAIVCETNFGGDMVKTVIKAIDPSVNVQVVTASRGKQKRAEPVKQLFKEGTAHLVGDYGLLEAQMTTWVPPGQVETDIDGVAVPISPSNYSPDRLDAMVWALTYLQLGPVQPRSYMRYQQ